MIDKEKVKKAVDMLLEAIGEDTAREGLTDTPDRVARMYEEIFAGYEDDASERLSRQFEAEETGSANGIVIEKDISFYSMCEHHMMPFFGKVHIAYIPDKKIVGLSKLARTVEVFARRLQVQERFTSQIADAVSKELGAKGVMVVASAEHTCMTMRGVKKPGTKTVTMSLRGEFEQNEGLKNTALSLIYERGNQ
ncbi:MAG: GTP cyclohydrolase I FolE [Lachnospiraceae bacterium]|nr:GTP cyclohydrolase I FolE [Lachnospiraceae bacterium]